MIPDASEINARIAARQPCTFFDPGTYSNIDLFYHFCDHGDCKWVAIRGFYGDRYGWSEEQCRMIHAASPDGWVDGVGTWRAYDWGKGFNKVISTGDERDWHEPQFDHVVPRSRGGSNDPGNMQVLPRIVNRILSNIAREQAPLLLPVITEQLIGAKGPGS
jgi:hypothetical protein